MELTAKERQGRGLDDLAAALRPYVEQRMAAAIPADNWVPLYEAKETHRLGRPVHLNLDDPRQLLRMIRYEKTAFSDLDGSQRAWLEELVQSANRAAHNTEISQRQADRALDTMLFLAESFRLSGLVPQLIQLRMVDAISASTAPSMSSGSAGAAEDSAGHATYSSGDPTDRQSSTEHDRPTDSAPNEHPEPAPSSALPAVQPRTPESSLQPQPQLHLPRGMRALTGNVDDARIVVLYREAVNLALAHNGVSPIVAVEITNSGDEDLTVGPIMINIESPASAGELAVGVPLRLEAATVAASTTDIAQASQLAMVINPAVFLALDEAVSTTIRLSVEGTEAVSEGSIRLLTADEWWAASIPESLAAFVRPNDPALTELLQESAALLQKQTGSASLEGYQAGAQRVQQIAEAIYQALSARNITYVEPPASFEGTGQRIRSHGQVLQDKMGTCLDLACLYAAALEQAGINAVLAVFDKHAFTGYLTEDDQLPAVVLDRQSTVITLADSDFFDAIDLTGACQPSVSFNEARNATAPWWSADISTLRFLLDVTSAHHRVKPLPTIRQVGDTRVIEVVRDTAWEPVRRAPSRTESRARIDPQTAETPPRIQRWERALLDMTYANPLLRRKKASSIGVHIPAGSLGDFEDLVTTGQELRLVAQDEIAQIHQAQGARTAADIDPAAVRNILQREHRLFIALAEKEYPTRLRNLARRSKTAVEETGSDNLYLTLGTLTWADGPRWGAAPLFLVPIKLRGGRGVVPFSISFDESRERVPNYCLIEKLRASYGLELPDLEMPEIDDSGIDVAGALAAIRTAILQTRNTVDFQVTEDAHVALLQFSTLEMWQDLRRHWPQLIERPAVRHLVDNPGRAFTDDITPPEPEPTDEATTYLPIPADGSQIDAVRWAEAGKTFILEGPPGTGKSQTITNLIANSMARGQRVLFVAEKAAALEVVKRRLDEIGLGVFSLDVHGKTQSVTAVRDQLRGALEEYDATSPGWEPLQSAYGTVTASLARYPSQLHQEGPVGLSAWEARQLILEQTALGADEATAIDVPRSVVLGDHALPELYAAAQDLSATLFDLGTRPVDSPWRLSNAVEVEQLDRQRIADAVTALQQATTAVAQHQPLVELAGRLLGDDQFAVLADWLDTVAGGIGWPTGPAGSIADARWLEEADRRRAAIANFRAAQDQQLGVFSPAVLERDLDGWLVCSQEIDHKFFGKKKRRTELLNELRPLLRSEPELDGLTSALQGAKAVASAAHQLRDYLATLPAINPRPGWNAFTDEDVAWFEAVVGGVTAAARLRQMIGELPAGSTPTVDDLDRLTEQLVQSPPRSAGQAGGPAAGPVGGPDAGPVDGQVVRQFATAWSELRTAVETDRSSIETWLAGRSRDEALAADLSRWSDDARGTALIALQRWVRLNAALHHFRQAGVDDLVRRALSGELSALDVEPQLRIGIARAVLDERLATTGLSGFDEVEHGRRIEAFRARGEQVRDRMPHELKARVVQSRTFDPNARLGNVGDLRAELERRRGGRSVRRLLHDFEALISQITPCFLMSPHSVARFLPPTTNFDLVVFDEASQIRVPESIGAIGRGAATIIVGDSKQMPPSAMFAVGNEDLEEELDSDSALVPVDLESILSEAVESQFPRKLLTWHYRSRDESLISFSNNRYYDGRLSSFPVPPHEQATSAIQYRRVAGVWEGGGSGAARVNRAEAEAIVAEIRSIIAEQPGHSVGVVTFNSQQRDVILDLIEGGEDEVLARQLQRDDEPLFVKNLENVQGDERDIILFSLAFSEDDRGRIPLNWGPLTRSGGERRLNVAITRAKEQVIIFGSFDPRRLDLSNSSSQGLADLKEYLLLAAHPSGPTRLRRDAADKHLDEVAARLRDAGLEVRVRVGLSDFVVDLAVRQPSGDGWVAVLLDGPEWASRESVGDRETLPTSILGQMHWADVERVWLPTWLRDEKSVVATISDAATRAARVPVEPAALDPGANEAGAIETGAIEAGAIGDGDEDQQLPRDAQAEDEDRGTVEGDSVSSAGSTDGSADGGESAPERVTPVRSAVPAAAATPGPATPGPPTSGPATPGPGVQSERVESRAQERSGPDDPHRPKAGWHEAPELTQPAPTPYEIFRPAAQDAVHDSALLDAGSGRSRATVQREIGQIIAAEAPILRSRLVTILANRFDISRVRESRRVQLREQLSSCPVREAANGDLVVWPADRDPDAYDGFRIPAAGERRDITTVPYEELRNAMVHVARASYGADDEDLLRETAHLFGISRLASRVRPRLVGVLDAALQEGRLERRDGGSVYAAG